MSNSKILLTYGNEEGEYNIESVWATKEGSYYRISNIPFFAPNVALDDLISVEEDEGALCFDSLIKSSGHSTIQMVVFDVREIVQIGKDLESLGCTWEGSHIRTLISIDIPKEVSYTEVKQYLDNREKEQRWSYKEACLSHKLNK